MKDKSKLLEAAQRAMNVQLNRGQSMAQKTSRLLQVLSGENSMNSQKDLKRSLEEKA